MLPIIIPAYNRPRLLKQTLYSLFKHSRTPIYPIIIDDFSGPEIKKVCQPYLYKNQLRYYRLSRRCGPGIARTYGAAIAPPHEYLYFSDSDMYFEKDWDRIIITALKHHPSIGIMSGFRDPVNTPIQTIKAKTSTIEVTEQIGGASMLISRENWLKFGPFKTNKLGVSGEDTHLCQHIKGAGLLLGCLNPPAVIHCGYQSVFWVENPSYKSLFQLKLTRPDLHFE